MYFAMPLQLDGVSSSVVASTLIRDQEKDFFGGGLLLVAFVDVLVAYGVDGPVHGVLRSCFQKSDHPSDTWTWVAPSGELPPRLLQLVAYHDCHVSDFIYS